MLGRGVAESFTSSPARALLAPEVLDIVAEADLFVLNLECCVSERGRRFPDPRKPFFFRAPPAAAETLAGWGVSCVTLANNHALDFGEEALLDTFAHLASAGIAWVGAGPDLEQARAPAILEGGGLSLGVVGLTDHPVEYAARSDRAGVAFADLRGGSLPDWLLQALRGLGADAVLVTPHWGPNMADSPARHARAAARSLLAAGATLVAGHSAHVFHGVDGPVLYDLGDFLDDYATDPVLRNDLGLLFLVHLDERGPVRLEAVPLRLEFCHTRLAVGDEADWVRGRFRRACAELGTSVEEEDERLVVGLR